MKLTSLRLPILSLILGVLAGFACTSAPPGSIPPDSDVIFRDDFDDPGLSAGWTFDGQAPGAVSLDARDGFARVAPGVPAEDAEDAGVVALLRDAEGDFVLATQMTFDPNADRQGAGLFIRGSDGRTVSFGILEASGPLGSFTGLVAAAERAGGLEPISQFEVFAGTEVTLRLERVGEDYEASFSSGGSTFSSLPLLRTDLSDAVQVGVANFVGDNCSSRCDAGSFADFDFFEIRRSAGAGGA